MQLELYKGNKVEVERVKMEFEKLKDTYKILVQRNKEQKVKIETLEQIVDSLKQERDMTQEKSNQFAGLLEQRQIQKLEEKK